MKNVLGPISPAMIAIALLVSGAFAQQATPPAAPAPQTTQTTSSTPTQTTEDQIGAAPLRVRVNKSVLINTRDRLKRVSVTDPGADTVPQVQDLDPTVPGGMGLFLVEQISSDWGVERTRAGENRVWFQLAA